MHYHRQPRYLPLTDRKLCVPVSRRVCPFEAVLDYGAHAAAICRLVQTEHAPQK